MTFGVQTLGVVQLPMARTQVAYQEDDRDNQLVPWWRQPQYMWENLYNAKVMANPKVLPYIESDEESMSS